MMIRISVRLIQRTIPYLCLIISLIIVWLYKNHQCYDNGDNKKSLINQPVVFIGGVPRSGTTLMRAMLDAHPSIRCGEETRVIPNILMLLQKWEKEGHKHLLDLAGVSRHVLNHAVGAFISEIIENHGSKADLYCDKDPLSLLMIPRINEIFPKSKFLLMIRDGRASVHSMITRKVPVTGFDRTNKTQMLGAWNTTIAKMISGCNFVGSNTCLKVYYEKLILSPKEQMERILKFIDVDFSENVLEHEKHIGDEIRLSPKEFSTSQVKNKINQEALSAWVGFYPDDVLKNLDSIAPMLRKLGYDTKRYKPSYDDLPIQ